MNTILKTLRTPVLAASALALAATGLSVLPTPATAQSATDRAQIDTAVGALRAISSMRADFVQTDRNGQRVGGVMTLKRPGKIRFQYQKGVPFLIVADGSSLTMIDYEVRQVQRWPIRNSPLGALLDPNKDVARFARLNPTANPSVLSIDVKDPRHPEYGTITLIMVRKASAPGGWELDSWVALDSQAKRTTVRLTNHQYGIAVPDNTFRFNDPRTQNRRAG
ncbi:LolA family protein [Novosphingobium cyanobacteriorum]|uniref:Outer membrane lipoprotein carrier protein LolA n=1 Tax=Novosphingobium cyanobacteriorum TaxID=3024215 RepID=A0ABT6CJ84_9SPHN|nr:outer membrane lipoprotein carrier protein LolA [Novosphingobium cyanobacteriorum]MDF8333150.1 outer membrane lipoprotein carrier protein LolA [Novosphingobium cyanobacteriorum]